MRVTVGRESFGQAVSWAARALPSRPVSPAFSGIAMQVDAAVLTLTASDGQLTCVAEVPVTTGSSPGDGHVVAHGQTLADLAKALPDGPAEISCGPAGLQVRCGRGRYTVPVLAAEGSLRLPEAPRALGRVSASALAGAVAQVAASASRDDAVPVLTAVRCVATGDAITLLATDRYRLAATSIPWASSDGMPPHGPHEAEFLVPASSLTLAARAFAPAGGDVALAVGPARAMEPGYPAPSVLTFTAPGRYLATGLFDDLQYPAMHRLLERSRPRRAEVRAEALIEAVRRIAIFAESAGPVRLVFSTGQLMVEAGSGTDPAAQEHLPAQFDGEPLTLSLNPAYLLDGLHALGSPVAVFALSGPADPPLLTGGSGSPGGYRYLVQPVRAVRPPGRVS